jgi:hypothetical protein
MKWAVSPVTWHAENDWVGCCVITTDKKLPDLPIQKWRRTTHRSMRSPLFYQREDASIVLGRRKTKPHAIVVDRNSASLPIPILGERRICWTSEYLDLTRERKNAPTKVRSPDINGIMAWIYTTGLHVSLSNWIYSATGFSRPTAVFGLLSDYNAGTNSGGFE